MLCVQRPVNRRSQPEVPLAYEDEISLQPSLRSKQNAEQALLVQRLLGLPQPSPDKRAIPCGKQRVQSKDN